MVKRKPLVFLLAILISQLLVSVVLGASVSYGAGYSKAPVGTLIWGKDLSGMTKEEAYEVLIKEIPTEVVYNEKVYPLELEQTYEDLKEYLNSQYAISTGSRVTDAFEYMRRISLAMEAPERFNEKELLTQLQKIAQEIAQPGQGAKLIYANGVLNLEKGSPEIRLDIEKSKERLYQSNGFVPVSLVEEVLAVHPTTDELEMVKDTLGDYTTYFDPHFYERVVNVQLAAQAMDGHILPPGAEFSFNDVVGKRDKERGYLPALVFVDNRVVTDDGGGICQDSTTLYQATKQARLEVLERYTHSLPVSYVPIGEDATVAYGVLDFRFRNNTNGYLLISATTGRNWIRVRLFGVSDSNHPVLQEPDGYPIKPSDWLNDQK